MMLVFQVTAVDAAELWFGGVHLSTSDTDLAWLYNILTTLAQQPIQDAITREVSAQVSGNRASLLKYSHLRPLLPAQGSTL